MSKPKIVVIEDEIMILNVIKETLQMSFPDYEILTFSDIPKCDLIDQSTKDDVKILITDCNLPSGDFCFSDCYKNNKIPTILITGDTTRNCDRENCVVLHKPFQVAMLIQTVNQFLK